MHDPSDVSGAQTGGATSCLRLEVAAGRSNPTPEARGSGLEEQPHVQGTVAAWAQDWKRSVFISIPKKGRAKECSIYRTIALISHASKVMLKILQARLQQYVKRELPDVQAGFRKGRRTRD